MSLSGAWWRSRIYVLLLLLAAAIPMLWPAFAPLTDAPGHIGRYRILAEAGVPPLSQHYDVHWTLVGNLGVDALVLALRPLLDIEPAAKLVIGLIPIATVAAMLWAAREAHGKIPAATAFALPLAYGFPFQLGFVNFCLAATLAIAGLAFWLRLARTRPTWVRLAVFLPYAGLVWLCHSFGWAMLGLFITGAEWRLRMATGERWHRAAFRAALMTLPMIWPAAIMIAGGSDRLSGDTGDWFHWSAKAQWAISLLRERWKIYDIASVTVLACLLWTAIRSSRLSFVSVLAIPALLGLAAFLLLPRLFQGGAEVDMRILPYVAAVGLLAIRVTGENQALERCIATLATGFFALRMATTTAAFVLFSHEQTRELQAIDTIPRGSAVLVLVNEPTLESWYNPRLSHIAGIAIARRRVFANEQWALSGQQLIRPRHAEARPFESDPSQIIHPIGSDDPLGDFDQAIGTFNRCTFQRVWTIGFPAGRAHATDLTVIWSNGTSAVYAVKQGVAACASPVTAASTR